MASVHQIPLFPQILPKPALARVTNWTVTCILPRASRTLTGTGTSQREQACAPAWRVCCRFRHYSRNRQEKSLLSWKRFLRFESAERRWLELKWRHKTLPLKHSKQQIISSCLRVPSHTTSSRSSWFNVFEHHTHMSPTEPCCVTTVESRNIGNASF